MPHVHWNILSNLIEVAANKKADQIVTKYTQRKDRIYI